MKHTLLVFVALMFLLIVPALADEAALVALPANDFADAVLNTYGAQGLAAEAEDALRTQEGLLSPEGFYVADHFCLAVENGGAEARGKLPLSAPLSESAVTLGVACAFDGEMHWFCMPASVDGNGLLDASVDAEGVRLMRASETTLFFLLCDSSLQSSALYRDVDFGDLTLDGYYHSLGDDYMLFGRGNRARRTTARQYFEAWDALVAPYPEYVAAEDLGVSSDGATVCRMYTFRPEQATGREPKIIIVSGQHGYEKVAPFGLYYFARDLLEHWQEDDTLAYFRHGVTLVLLPCMNPYGFDNFVRVNANGVDLNRNYGLNFGREDVTSSGTEAFSEPETSMVRDVVEANMDAMFLIDFHNFGQNKLAAGDYTNTNWHSYNELVLRDPYYHLMYEASLAHIDELAAEMKPEYGQPASARLGNISTANSPHPMLRNWALSKGLMAMTFEALGGFTDDRYDNASFRAQKANAELIGNWIRNVIRTFAEAQP